MSRRHYPAEGSGVWLCYAFATETGKDRRKLPDAMRRLERQQSRNESAALNTCGKTVIANNDLICTTDKMTHRVHPNDGLCLAVLFYTDLNRAFVKDTLPNDHPVDTPWFDHFGDTSLPISLLPNKVQLTTLEQTGYVSQSLTHLSSPIADVDLQ